MKKIICLILCLAMLLPMLISAAMAEPAKDKSIKNINADVNNANREIKQLVKLAQKTSEDDVDQLLAQVDAIVARVQAHADAEGAMVICTTDTYFIDGQWVEIDPLMVINIRQ